MPAPRAAPREPDSSRTRRSSRERRRVAVASWVGASAFTSPALYSMQSCGMGPTLRRYFLREVAVPFTYGIAVFTFILLIARMLKLVELVVNRGVSLLEIGKLFSYI